ncbi:Imm61 family immunity protein [Paenarthrobacter sp. NPDC057355]|uniref:Imm61 family immunity protein n=1 Tax=Paenarthrobacter sp. NPDC057355 TaxID=3346105 RepID=UPI003635025C
MDFLEALVARIMKFAGDTGIGVSSNPSDKTWFLTMGDVRQHLKIRNGAFVLGVSHRGQPENDVFVTSLASNMEKYLLYQICMNARFSKNLPLLLTVPIPVTREKVAPGFVLTGHGRNSQLIDQHTGAISFGNDVDLVEFSHYAALTPDDLVEACLAPHGKSPFFVEDSNI